MKHYVHTFVESGLPNPPSGCTPENAKRISINLPSYELSFFCSRLLYHIVDVDHEVQQYVQCGSGYWRERFILCQHDPGVGIWRLPQRQHVAPSTRRLSFGLSWPFYLLYIQQLMYMGLSSPRVYVCMNEILFCHSLLLCAIVFPFVGCAQGPITPDRGTALLQVPALQKPLLLQGFCQLHLSLFAP